MDHPSHPARWPTSTIQRPNLPLHHLTTLRIPTRTHHHRSDSLTDTDSMSDMSPRGSSVSSVSSDSDLEVDELEKLIMEGE